MALNKEKKEKRAMGRGSSSSETIGAMTVMSLATRLQEAKTKEF